MGNTSSHQTPQQKYSYLHSLEDPHFGPCNIYRNSEISNSFVVCISHLLPQQDVRTIERNLKSLISQNLHSEMQSPFLKIFEYRINDIEQTLGHKIVNTCKLPSVTFWVEFLRHDLKEFLHWRKAEKRQLTLNEVIMAISKAIKAYEMTKNNEIFGPSLNLKDISITIQGEMKFHPLLGKSFFENLSTELNGYKSCQTSPLRERIMEKRAFRQQKQNINPKFITSTQYRYFLPHLSKDSEFLGNLKKFANQIVLASGLCLSEIKNPQDVQFDQRRQIQRFLNEFQRIKGLSEAKKFLGSPKTNCFFIDFAKLKHEQSQAKFSKILSGIEQRSQKTDYSYHESSNCISPQKTPSSKSIQFITPYHYNYS